MPTVYRERGFRFYFWSNERNEPPHIHIRSGDGYAKVWLGPPVVLAESHDYDPHEIRVVLEIAAERRAMMEQAWYEHFGT